MRFYNLMQVKENLPEILERIASCKKMADAQLFLYRCLVQQCIFETTHPDVDYGVWTTESFMAETWNNYKSYIEEANYLQKMVDAVRTDKFTISC